MRTFIEVVLLPLSIAGVAVLFFWLPEVAHWINRLIGLEPKKDGNGK